MRALLVASGSNDPEHRWRALIASAAIMCSSGAVYLFSSYSADLAELMHLNTTELNVIGTAGNVGLWCGLLPGMFLDRYGPYSTIQCGAAMTFAGLAFMGFIVDGLFPLRSHWWLAFANALLCHGQGWAYLGGMKAALKNFRSEERGRLVGALACFFGISAGVSSTTYKALFQNRAPLSYFFFTIAFVTAIVQLGAAEILRVPAVVPQRHLVDSEKQRFRWMQGSGIAIALWILVMNVVHVYDLHHWLFVGLWLVMMGLLGVVGVLPRAFSKALPVPSLEEDSQKKSGNAIQTSVGAAQQDDPSLKANPFNSAAESATSDNTVCDSFNNNEPQTPGSATTEEVMSPAIGPSFKRVSWTQSLRSTEYLLTISSFALALAFPITLLNNASTLVVSLQTTHSGDEDWEEGDHRLKVMQATVGLLVAAFSSFNTIGRSLFGYAADRFSDKAPRPAWVVVTALLLLAANVLLVLFLSMEVLYLVVPLTGLAMGGIFSLYPVTIVDIFGLDKYGRLWGVLTMGPVVGTVFFSTLLAGHMADEHSKKSSLSIKGNPMCHGKPCYHTTFVATAVAVAAAVAFGLMLVRRLHTSTSR